MTYNQALDSGQNVGVNGIDLALSRFQLDGIVAPTDGPAWTTDLINADHFLFASSGLAAPPGYPIVQVPSGMVLGVPVGISFLGTAFSEPTLIKLASGFEAATHARRAPTFADSLPSRNVSGVPLAPQRAQNKDARPVPRKRPYRM
jgi:amidase